MWNTNGSLADANAGEVPMVPAIATMGYPSTWPTDGRAGGVPDPASAGPNMLQIGTESGFLPAPAELVNQPIDYNTNRRDIVVLNVSSKTLLLGPAERADVIIDFSKYAGKTLILYNDSPAPVPAFDTRYDYYSGDPDQTTSGGAPTTQPGYGPNTRTIMQIKVANTNASLAGTGVSSLVSTNKGTGYTSPTVSITGAGGTGAAASVLGSIDNLALDTSGAGYTSAPAVTITGAATTPATAKASISVSSVAVTTAGAGYTSAPAVTITDVGVIAAAKAKATIAISAIGLLTPGAGYTSAPTVAITDSAGGMGTGATATATITAGQVSGITMTSAGTGYTAPIATLTGGRGTGVTTKLTGSLSAIEIVTPGVGYYNPVVNLQGGGATTTATAKALGVDRLTVLNQGLGYITVPTVTLVGGGATTLGTASATLKFTDFMVTNAGSGYTTGPTVTIVDSAGGSGTGATATANLITAGTTVATALPAAFTASQQKLIVPSGVYARIQDTSMTFTPVGETAPITMKMQPKAIQELFETDYGRMNATMGMELPNTNVAIQTTIPYGYVDPVTEIISDITPNVADGTQIWKITHNGVDTHSIHFHLFDVQVINRVGWDGAVRPPDPNELGLKDTVKMSPLEDCIVALRPIVPKTNFGIPDSIRPLDVTMPIGATGMFLNIDPTTGNPVIVKNEIYNFGWEYMWHCHLLGHEENDMMRPIQVNVPHLKPAASVLSAMKVGAKITLTWTDTTPASTPTTLGNPANEIGYNIQRATIRNGVTGSYAQIGTALANATTYSDLTAKQGTSYSYRVVTFNATGTAVSNTIRP